MIKVADILKWAQVSEGSSIRFTSYDNYTVDFDFLEVINDEKKLVLISTNVPSWKMGDFDNAKTLEGRGSGNEGGFILRGVKRITVHSQTSAVSKVTKNGCDSKVYISIEDALSHSKSACNLSLAGKELSELPTDITKLTKLTILNLGHNSFSEFPQELLSLTDLEEINLSSNTLTTLPDMSTLSKLTSLKLGRNQFEQFPLSVLTLTNLRTLELDNNKLTSVPAEITQLSALEEFEFANNNISSLPPEVAALKTLKEVDLKGNPLSATEKRNIKSYFPRAKVEF